MKVLVKVSGGRAEDIRIHPERVSWSDRCPWESCLREKKFIIDNNPPLAKKLNLQLALQWAAPSCYFALVDIVDEAPSAVSSGVPSIPLPGFDAEHGTEPSASDGLLRGLKQTAEMEEQGGEGNVRRDGDDCHLAPSGFGEPPDRGGMDKGDGESGTSGLPAGNAGEEQRYGFSSWQMCISTMVALNSAVMLYLLLSS